MSKKKLHNLLLHIFVAMDSVQLMGDQSAIEDFIGTKRDVHLRMKKLEAELEKKAK